MTGIIHCANCGLNISPENWEMHKEAHNIENETSQLSDEGRLVAFHIIDGRLRDLAEYR
jgi:hypothetical protein